MDRKRGLSDDNEDDLHRDYEVVQSSWLGTFLSRKRKAIVLPPPEVCAVDDLYLQEFCNQFAKRDDSEDDEISLAVNTLSSLQSPSELRTGSAQDPDNGDATAVKNGKLRLYNLPYNMDALAVTKAGAAYGYEFVNVVIEIAPSTGLPSGAADIELGPGIVAALAAQALQGEDFGGRPVRVKAGQQKGQRLSGGRASTRYFTTDDVDAICKNCGEVGHVIRHCTASNIIPCHLCAGRDHEAGTSVFLSCYC